MLLHCELVCKACLKMRQVFKADSWGREDVSVGAMLPVQVCSSVLSLEKEKTRHCGAGEGFLVLSDKPLWPYHCISGPSEKLCNKNEVDGS